MAKHSTRSKYLFFDLRGLTPVKSRKRKFDVSNTSSDLGLGGREEGIRFFKRELASWKDSQQTAILLWPKLQFLH